MLKLGRWIGRGMVIAGVSWMFSITALAGTDLKINPDALKRVGKGRYVEMTPGELFIGLGSEGCTYGELGESMRKYQGEEDYFELNGKNGTSFTINGSDGVCIEIADSKQIDIIDDYLSNGKTYEDIDNAIANLRFYSDGTDNGELFYVGISNSNETDVDLIIFHIVSVNGSLALNGWQQEPVGDINCWVYYENGAKATGFRWINGELYCFEENGSMIHDGFREINGHKYHFNKDWADRGWQRLEESGDTGWYYFSMEDASAMKGYVSGIEGDSFQYFFWTDGYTDQNGKTYPSGALAQGEDSSDRWVFKDGRAVYVADKDGHLYTDTQMTVGGKAYDIDGEGNVTLAHSSSEKFRQKVESVLQAYPVERTWNGEGECHGFAMNLLMKVFETDNGYREDFCSDSCSEDHGMHNKVGIKTSDIQEGDLVRITGHSFFVTEIENRADGTYIKTREAWGDKGNLIMDNEWKIVSDTELEGKPGVWNPKLKLQYIRRIKNRDSHLLFQ